jgi:3'-5' exoribonuclease
MTKPKKPAVVKLSEMHPGEYADCFVQLSERKRGSTHSGKPYYTCRFRDSHRTASVMVWADSEAFEQCQEAWQIGQFFKIRATLEEHEKYGLQLSIEQIRLVEDRDRDEGFTELEFLERSRHNPEEMFEELKSFVSSEITDEPLRSLVSEILDSHAVELKRLPGSVRHYYPFAGGWLEHTLNVTRNCAILADRYAQIFPDLTPPLNRNLVIAGAVLHDIGRVVELEFVPGQPTKPGISGELFGHLFLANNLIRSAGASIPNLNPELLELLVHLVVSHLRLPEWGSPRLPCIPEVLILHHADDLDAKFEMYARCLTRDLSEGPFTERDPTLGRALLKRRSV